VIARSYPAMDGGSRRRWSSRRVCLQAWSVIRRAGVLSPAGTSDIALAIIALPPSAAGVQAPAASILRLLPSLRGPVRV